MRLRSRTCAKPSNAVSGSGFGRDTITFVFLCVRLCRGALPWESPAALSRGIVVKAFSSSPALNIFIKNAPKHIKIAQINAFFGGSILPKCSSADPHDRLFSRLPSRNPQNHPKFAIISSFPPSLLSILYSLFSSPIFVPRCFVQTVARTPKKRPSSPWQRVSPPFPSHEHSPISIPDRLIT